MHATDDAGDFFDTADLADIVDCVDDAGMAASQKDDKSFIRFEPHRHVIGYRIGFAAFEIQEEGVAHILESRQTGNRAGNGYARQQVMRFVEYVFLFRRKRFENLFGTRRRGPVQGLFSRAATETVCIDIASAIHRCLGVYGIKVGQIVRMVIMAVT